MFKIAYYTSSGRELNNISTVIQQIISKQGEIIDLMALKKADVRDESSLQKFTDYLKEADFVLLYLTGGKKACPVLEELLAAVNPGAEVHLQTGGMKKHQLTEKHSTVSTESAAKIAGYFSCGGKKNIYHLFCFLLNEYGNYQIAYQSPQYLPLEGIYHPQLTQLQEELSVAQYYRKMVDPEKMTAGILFHRSQWLNGNTDFVDQVIAELKKEGLNAVPIFLASHQITGENDNTDSIRDLFNKYFKKNGRTSIDFLINFLMFSFDVKGKTSLLEQEKNVFSQVDIPVLKAIISLKDKKSWQDNPQGLSPVNVSLSIAMPEIDGNLITFPLAFKTELEYDPYSKTSSVEYVPDQERIASLVRLGKNWARLAHLEAQQKKVAIIFHNYPPRDDNIGSAFGLDSPASVYNICQRLAAEGYLVEDLPDDPQQLMEEIRRSLTNERNWASPQQLAEKAVASVSAADYNSWFTELPGKVREQMISDWGSPPGEYFNYQSKILIPGICKGNVFIGIQPPRGFQEDTAAIYHNPELSMPHYYFAFYKWIKEIFKADAILHIGKHGSLEWLPGKNTGLSADCFPDIAIAELPNIYPYIINNPGEGTQAKRRSYCAIIDHLIPLMENAELYQELSQLEELINQYYQAEQQNQEKLQFLQEEISKKVQAVNLDRDLALLGLHDSKSKENFREVVDRLHSYLAQLKDNQIRNGLHVFGSPPAGEKLSKFIVALTRLENGEQPSLRKTVASSKGYDLEELLSKPAGLLDCGRTANEVLEEIESDSLKIIEQLIETGFAKENIAAVCREILPEIPVELEKLLQYIGKELLPRLAATSNEMDNTLRALAGKFVPPGPSGAPTRGMAGILPTGRNFFSVNPKALPSTGAWQVGKDLADNMLQRYQSEQGQYPENIGLIIWGSPTMRTGGDDIAEGLYLLGVKPVWQEDKGYLKDLQVIPLEELGRPRIDVTFRTSGFFRDAFPNILELLDRAVKMVAFLDEPAQDNFVAKHVREEIEEGSDRVYRVFSCKPGCYGAGVNQLIDSKDWQENSDLSQVYQKWGGYVYGEDIYGQAAEEVFARRLSQLDIAIKNADTREYDIMDVDDFFSYQGGMVAAVEELKGSKPVSYIGDSSNPGAVKTKTTAEEASFVFRSRIFNPKWIKAMQEHGYKGASDISRTVDLAFGWDATTGAIDDWIYEELASKFVFAKEMQDWLKSVNSQALRNITERLLEAIQRGLWQPEEEIKEKLTAVYLQMEGQLEGFYDR